MLPHLPVVSVPSGKLGPGIARRRGGGVVTTVDVHGGCVVLDDVPYGLGDVDYVGDAAGARGGCGHLVQRDLYGGRAAVGRDELDHGGEGKPLVQVLLSEVAIAQLLREF